MLYSRIFLFITIFIFSCTLCVLGQTQANKEAGKKYKALIIDGQNNHKNWPETTRMMKGYLEETGLFSAEIATTPPEGQSMNNFTPDFSKYDLVLSNYNGDPWPQRTNKAFEDFVKNGGGVVIVHAANNAFPEWQEYNKIIGVGGWKGRDEKSGPFVYYDEEKSTFVKDTSPGPGGAHGVQHRFQVTIRNKNHPITKGLPATWMHENDELYHQLRGPAQNMEVLATAYSAKDTKGSGRHEPMLMVITYGKGRIFHTTLGHGNDSQQGKGFIITLQRGAEWAVTGKVTQKIPKDFLSLEQGSSGP